MRKTAPVRGGIDSFGPRGASMVGDALRVLQQVDSDLHLSRLADASRELKRELAEKGLAAPARIAGRIVDLTSTALEARSPLDSHDLRTIHREYSRLTRSLEVPPRNGRAEPRRVFWAPRRKG